MALKSSSSKEAYADFLSRRPMSGFLPRLTPTVRFWLAVMIVILASAYAFMQSPRPDALRPPRRVFSAAWWRYPLELNAANRLQKVECTLRAIQANPRSATVWAVGHKGMVVNSSDNGQTWIKKGIETRQLSREDLRPPAVGSNQSLWAWPELIPTALAAQTPQRPPPTGTPTPSASVRPVLIPAEGRSSPTPVTTPTSRRTTTGPRQQGTPLPSPVSSSATSSPYPSPSPLIPQTSPEAEDLIAVNFVDESQGAVVSSMGTLYLTGNGGTIWIAGFLTPYLETARRSGLEFYRFPFRSLQFPPVSYAVPAYRVITNAGTVSSLDDYNLVPGLPDNFPGYPVNAEFVLRSPLESKDISSLYEWTAAPGGIIYHTRRGTSWDSLQTGSSDDLYGIFFANPNRGWVVGANGTIFTTTDLGTTWQKQESGTTSQLNAVHFLPDSQHGWIAGNDGTILSTEDGGSTWTHRTQGSIASGRYLRFPAPWYFLVLLLVGLFLWRQPKVKEAPPEESVADVLVSDRPLEEAAQDVLAFNSIARGLSRFLRNENTLPPLTIAITGEWGTGKSSLMNLLRADLRSYKFRPVWFNAWHHQKEEHMLASLLENIKLQAVPRWWTTRGMLFRARLLQIRGVRQWLPLVLLLLFIYVFAVYYYHSDRQLFNFTSFGVGTKLAPQSSRVATSPVMSASPAPSPSPTQAPFLPTDLLTVLPILAGLATFVGAVWRGITAFGVKPASLLAGVSRGVSIRGLEAQTSFRQKFAVEFNDVTRALGKRSLLIFIDDLDRCRPENVLETLEAVNFLTTSGECFVVIGMAREYVERCVGRAFNEVAQEMVDDFQEEVKESAEDIAKQKRIEFARQYLDKLVNIEVPVPAPKQSQSLALLVASTREVELSKPASRWQAVRLATANFIERRWRMLATLLVTTGLIIVGYYMARDLARNEMRNAQQPGAVVFATPQPLVEPIAAPASSASPGAFATPEPTAAPTPISTPDTERPALLPGARALVSPGLLPLAALLALIWVGATVLTRKPGLVVKDSPRFIAALEIWHPVVFARQYTPRATKRFMNFVRYLAMRQRRTGDSEPPIKKFLDRLKDRFVGVRTTEQVIDEFINSEASQQQIPDEVLVALAALQHLNPHCLTEHPGPASSPDNVWPRAVSDTNPLKPLFEKAREDHEAEFHNWATLSLYREQFLEMTANVQVR